MISSNVQGFVAGPEFTQFKPATGLGVFRFQCPDGTIKFIQLPIDASFGTDFDSADPTGKAFSFFLPWGVKVEGFGFPNPIHNGPFAGRPKFDEDLSD